MAVQPNGNSQSIELAERALELIKRHNLSADPSSYATWYAYVGGNTAPARSIEGVVADKGNLSGQRRKRGPSALSVRSRHRRTIDGCR